MYCLACGQEIPDDSTFCSHCGAKQEVEQPKTELVYCNKCQKEFDSEMVYCDECGAKLQHTCKYKTDNTMEGLLLRMELASYCKGQKPIGSKMSSGTLYFFEDRIETRVMLNDKAKVLAKMEQIDRVTRGTYLKIWPSMTIHLVNGEAYTIAGLGTRAATIDRAIEIVNNYIE